MRSKALGRVFLHDDQRQTALAEVARTIEINKDPGKLMLSNKGGIISLSVIIAANEEFPFLRGKMVTVLQGPGGLRKMYRARSNAEKLEEAIYDHVLPQLRHDLTQSIALDAGALIDHQFVPHSVKVESFARLLLRKLTAFAKSPHTAKGLSAMPSPEALGAMLQNEKEHGHRLNND